MVADGHGAEVNPIEERVIETTTQPRTMLITGATGFIGSRLATLALRRGYRVRTLTRSEWSGAPAVAVSERYFAGLPGPIPAAALRDVQLVVHCAASMSDEPRQARAVNVEGTVQLVRLAKEAGVESFIFLSSQSARADSPSEYGRTKFAAEQALLAVSGIDVVILRPGVVTGPGGRGLYQRMRRTVLSLPAIPLLDGGRALVQPIHVDDLCEAIFRCDTRAAELNRSVLCLGDPAGLTLSEFLQTIARVELGRRKRTLNIPLRPVEIGVAIAEALGIPLPVSSTNLRGARYVPRMDTAPDLARLQLQLRPVEEAVSPVEDSSPAAEHEDTAESLNARAVRVLLIGAGRVGLLHSVTLSRLPGIELAGLVDRRRSATRLLRGMGIGAPAYADLGEAVAATQPDAAVVATPGATHLALARECLERGLAVMVEKPLAIGPAQLDEYERLLRERPDRPVQVGYFMLRSPQIAFFIERLRAGAYGAIRGFTGLALLSFIQQADSKRWEVKPEVSGGGALINSGGHVLSLILEACGEPASLEAESARLFSTGVEDSMIVRFHYASPEHASPKGYPSFEGTEYCSWSMPGYARQENLLSIDLDAGRLILTTSVAVFVDRQGTAEVVHQLDFDAGFNMAPDYGGAGFSVELSDLATSVRTGAPAPASAAKAIAVERRLFDAYARAQRVRSFSEPPISEAGARGRLPPGPFSLKHPSSIDAAPAPIRRALDLRELAAAGLRAFLSEAGARAGWDEYALLPGQLAGAADYLPSAERLRLSVPDFLTQSRMLAAGRYRDVLTEMGPAGLLRAAMAGGPLALAEHGPTFWVAAVGLLAAALATVPAGFSGTILVDGYLTDLALSLRRLDMLDRMLAACRHARPDARIGFHSSIPGEALSALSLLKSRVDEVSLRTSPSARNMSAMMAAMRAAGGGSGRTLTAEVGPAPSIVHELAAAQPEAWAHGAGTVLVGPAADPGLRARQLEAIGAAWTAAFPGAAAPVDVL